MSISKLFPSKYLKGDDIEDGDTVTITKVTVERVGIDQEEKPVIHFEEKDKGVILNKTNAQAIAKGGLNSQSRAMKPYKSLRPS